MEMGIQGGRCSLRDAIASLSERNMELEECETRDLGRISQSSLSLAPLRTARRAVGFRLIKKSNLHEFPKICLRVSASLNQKEKWLWACWININLISSGRA